MKRHNLTASNEDAVETSVAAHLASAEEQFAEIERVTKELRKKLDRVAETVRIAADEIRRTGPENDVR